MKFVFFIILVLISTLSTFAVGCGDRELNSVIGGPFGDLLNKASEFDETCFCFVLSKLLSKNYNSDSLVKFVKHWSQKNDLGNRSLFFLYKEGFLRNDKVWAAIVSLWERSHGSPNEEFMVLVNSGKPASADSLFIIFESGGKLDVHDLLRWARVKGVIGDFNRLAGLYCRILNGEPRLTSIALSQFNNILFEVPSGTADNILRKFYHCSLVKSGIDTVSICTWIADTYSRLGLYDRELAILSSLQDIEGIKERLVHAAQSHFTRNQFDPAISAAKRVYWKAEGELKELAVTIIYRSFIEQGRGDSALLWVERAGFKSDAAKAEAVVLYQNTGSLGKAKVLIDSLPRSMARDTLYARQLLFTGEFEKAARAVREGIFLQKSHRHAIVWKVRTLLFSHKIKEFSDFINTVKIQPTWEQSEELLSYKYHVQRLGFSPEALDTWAEIEYNIYVGKPENAVELFSACRVPLKLKWHIALPAAKILVEKGMSGLALKMLSCCDGVEVSPEFLYYKAQAKYGEGEVDSARQIMKNVVLDYPAGVFSEKARMFLSGIDVKN